MKLVRLEEFRHLSGLPDAALIWLLNHAEIAHSVDSEHNILIDLDAVHVKDAVSALINRQRTLFEENKSLFTEKVRGIIDDSLKSILDEALGK